MPDIACDFPDPASYEHLTAAHAAAAKKKGKASTVAAAVMPPIKDDDDSEDSEEDLDRISPIRLRIEHLFWVCLVEGSMSDLPLKVLSLIDNGCHLVMINEDRVDKLQLRRFKLHKPEDVFPRIDRPCGSVLYYSLDQIR
jgi:hypothetical protein